MANILRMLHYSVERVKSCLCVFSYFDLLKSSVKVIVEVTFTGEGPEKLKRFSKFNAPAHLFPFVREIIGNTTMKANIPPLLLPPLNISVMDGGKKQKK